MARKRAKPEQTQEPELAADVAALRAWTAAMRRAPERVLEPLEAAAKDALRDFGLPDDLGPHLLANLPPERGRTLPDGAQWTGPARAQADGSVTFEPARVWLNVYLRANTPEWRAAEILVAVREARRASSLNAAVVWTNRARGMVQRLERSLGGFNRKRRMEQQDRDLLSTAQRLWKANPRWSDRDLDDAVAAVDLRKRQPATLRRRLIDPALADGRLKRPTPR